MLGLSQTRNSGFPGLRISEGERCLRPSFLIEPRDDEGSGRQRPKQLFFRTGQIEPGHPLLAVQHGHLSVVMGRNIRVRMGVQDRVGLWPVPRSWPPDAREIEPVSIGERECVPRLRNLNADAGTRQRWVGKVRPSARTTVKGLPPRSRGYKPQGSSTISTSPSERLMMMRRSSSGASPEEIICGLLAAQEVFDKAGVTPEQAATARFVVEGWDFSGFRGKVPEAELTIAPFGMRPTRQPPPHVAQVGRPIKCLVLPTSNWSSGRSASGSPRRTSAAVRVPGPLIHQLAIRRVRRSHCHLTGRPYS